MSDVHFRYRLVVFDLDGTLIDSLEATFHCFQEALEPALGRRPAVSEIRSRFGPAEEVILEDWLGAEAAPAAIRRLYACYEARLHARGLFPGLGELLVDLGQAGIRLALFTGRGRPSAARILKALRLEGRFETTVTGEEASHPKPSPDGLIRILDRLGVSAGDAVYVGDSVLDLESASAAGMNFVLADWAPGREAPVNHAGPVARDAAALREHLEEPG